MSTCVSAVQHTAGWLIFAVGLGLTLGLVRWVEGRRRDVNVYLDETGEVDVDYEQGVLPLQIKAHPDLIAELQNVARTLAANGNEVSADDIHERVTIPTGVDRRVMSAAFQPKRDWEFVRYQKSRRADCHYRTIAVWRLREAVAA